MKKDYALAMRKIAICKEINVKPNFTALSRETNINRHTLSDMYHEKRDFKPRQRKSQLDDLKEETRDVLKDPAIGVASAFFYFTDEQRGEKQITCTYSNFLKFVQRNNLNVKEKNHIAHFRYETEPGEQLQVDWVESISLNTILGEIITFNLFSATLGYSRMHYFEYSISRTNEDFMRCLLHAFKYFGGKTKKVLTDNMPAVVHIDEKGNRIIHQEIAQFFKDLGIELKLCNPFTPQTKGKCENSNKFVKRLYSYNNKVKDELDLFRIIYRLNTTINTKYANQLLGVPPCMLFKNEKELLTELSELDYETLQTNYAFSSKVPQTGLINYKGRQYSVDSRFIGKHIKIIGDDEKVSIFYNTVLIATHKVSKQKINYLPEHYSKFLKDKGLSDEDVEKYSSEALERFKYI